MDVPDDNDDETLLLNLVYCSKATDNLRQDQLAQLVSAAQSRNARESITGWLVYSHGIFFQWLEGPRENVMRVMSSISADTRHAAILVLSEGEELRERVFLGWDMELVSAEDIKAVLHDAIEASSDLKSTGTLRALIRELESKAVGTPM